MAASNHKPSLQGSVSSLFEDLGSFWRDRFSHELGVHGLVIPLKRRSGGNDVFARRQVRSE